MIRITQPLKVGIIGLGRAGQIHLKNLQSIPHVHVTMVSDANEQLSSLVSASPMTHFTTDAWEIIHSPDVDAVVIACPTNLHIPYSMGAVKAGKHVFCEKPLDTTLEGIDELEALVHSQGIKFMVGFNRRFDGNFARIHQLKSEGKIGAPHLLKITSRDPAPPPYSYVAISGGLFIDMAIHDFDMARHIVGSEVTEVYVKADTLVDPTIAQYNDVDTAVTLLTFACGAIGVIDNSRKAVYGYDQRLEIFGSEGMLQAANNTNDNVTYYNQECGHTSLPLYFFLERYEKAFQSGILAFITCIQQDQPSPVTCHDGRMATAIALAATKSSIEKRPVMISEILEMSYSGQPTATK